MKRQIIWLTIFSIAMGYMESAVVIYLRALYYPDGFNFPLAPLDPNIGLVELLREAATIIMLLGIGILTSKTASQKFANFIYCFAIWDLFYYVFLWLFLGWPESLFTWDILFLIPVPWVGPVLAPIIVALTMMIFALSIISFNHCDFNTKLKIREWVLLGIGSFALILSFVWDYLRFIKNNSASFGNSKNAEMLSELKDYIPTSFNWNVYFVGEILLISAIILFIRRMVTADIHSESQSK